MSDKVVHQVLQCISKYDELDSTKISELLDVEHQKVVGAIKSIQCFPEVIGCKQVSSQKIVLTTEGEDVAKSGSHEANVYNAVLDEGISQKELMKKFSASYGKVGFSKAIAAKWIRVDKQSGDSKIFKNEAENMVIGDTSNYIYDSQLVDTIEDEVQSTLLKIQKLQIADVSDKQISEYKKRKLIVESRLTSFFVKKGPNFTTALEKEATDLTPEMISSGSWREKSFKPYCFTAQGKMPPSGYLHPLLKVRSEFRQIFLEMGFTEMPTNKYVESSFWNFDALFQPQQHPARDAHDTFFLSKPALSNNFPMDYLQRVSEVHSTGGYGSQGHRYDWDIEEAKKNILRTHTTAVSSRMLYKLAQEKEFRPAKYFSIDRVYRNEALDATHLAEFHQIEGLIADRNLGLGHLIGVLYEFFNKLGITKLRFKPAFNPYTEPSMEVFSYHEGLKKWVEVGNSGVFRPEMLLPMGLPNDVSVIAWGLSLERPTMIKYGYDNIRDLMGPKVDLRMVQNAPICQLD